MHSLFTSSSFPKRLSSEASQLLFLLSLNNNNNNNKNMSADLSNTSVESRVESLRGVFLKVGPVMVNVV